MKPKYIRKAGEILGREGLDLLEGTINTSEFRYLL